jgi:hypothetical protein
VASHVGHQVKAIASNLGSGRSPQVDTVARKISNDDLLIEAFIGFLSEGLYPWWLDIPTLDILETKLIALAATRQPKFRAELKRTLARKLACDRLAHQFSDRFTMQLIQIFFSESMADISLVNHHVTEILLRHDGLKDRNAKENLRLTAISHLWYHLFQNELLPDMQTLAVDIITSVSEDLELDGSDLMGKLPSKLLKGADRSPDRLKKVATKFLKDNGESKSDSMERTYVQNSGLVLLWPYLEKFFEGLELIRESRFRSAAAQQNAMLLMHYLVFGNQVFDEHQFTLTKLLAGWTAEKPVNRHHRLNEKHKAECLELLKAVIRNWDALKNTSVPGLQESFLRRNGKLTPASDGWTLRVEQRGMDVLMDNLPWSFRVVRLPWMTGTLHVEW